MRKLLTVLVSLGAAVYVGGGRENERATSTDGFPAQYEESVPSPIKSHVSREVESLPECQILARGFREGSAPFYILGPKNASRPTAIHYENGRCSYQRDFSICCSGNNAEMTENEAMMGSEMLRNIRDLERQQ